MILKRIKEGCRVGFFGLGRSNLSLLCCLPLDKCKLTLRSDRLIDRLNIPDGVRIRIFEGKDSCKNIDEDIIFFSPSVRRERGELVAARNRGVIFTSDAELFFEENKLPIFAVTGSDGKSTTATLIHLLLKEAGNKSKLIGNIGEPMVNSLWTEADCAVCELSSFMLKYLQPKVKAACITNISPNHLDWHSSFEEYKQTKLALLNGAEKTVLTDDFRLADCIISDKMPYDRLTQGHSASVYFTIEDGYILRNKRRLIRLADIKRKQKHEIRNLMMAIAMTDGLVGEEEICRVASSFMGLAHRCECFLSRGGIDFINSSIDSTPARTVQTLNSLNRRVVVILGGRGKGLDYRELMSAMKRYVKKAIITGENAEEIYDAIKSEIDAEIIDSFEGAVLRGNEIARECGALLLSPASTSYDKFKNYAERGDKFKQICLNISEYENKCLQNVEETGKNSETNLS